MSRSTIDNLKCGILLTVLFALALWSAGCHAPNGLPPSINATDSSLNKADAYADAAYRQSREQPVKKLIELVRSNIADGISSTWETATAFVKEHQLRLDSDKKLTTLEAKPYVKVGRFCERVWHATVAIAVGFMALGGALLVLKLVFPAVGIPLFAVWMTIFQFILDLLPKIFHRIAAFCGRLFSDAPAGPTQ